MKAHRLMPLFALGLLATIGFGVASCSWTENDTRSATAGLPDLTQSLMAHTWVLEPARSSIGDVGSADVTLEFTADSLGGTGPCNNYFGSYATDDDTIEVGPIGTTLRACEEPATGAETAYLAALENTLTVDATDRDRLVLTRSGVHLEYSAADTP
jgi:heat shock protein HslJ